MSKISFQIDNRFADKTLAEMLDYFALGKAKRKQMTFQINGKKLALNEVLKEASILEISYPKEPILTPWNQPLKVLYEDLHLLLVDKPAGILVHSDGVNEAHNLVNIVANYYDMTNQDCPVLYVHRLDLDTTGLVIFAKDPLTASYLNQEIASRTLHREYLCICSGTFQEDKGTYNYLIAEDRHQANKKRVGKTGKEAITHYQVLKRLKSNLNLCLVTLETGRTHQIRVHFSYSGHPLVGDKLYNGNVNLLSRQALHSYHVSFVHPFTLEKIDVKAEIPDDLNTLIEKKQ